MSGVENRRTDSQHPWHIRYSPNCICPGCDSQTYWDGKVYWSLCLGCLREKKLGPYAPRIHKEDYSTLIWLTDFENAQSRKEIA